MNNLITSSPEQPIIPLQTVFFVLPAYNEEARLGNLLDRIAISMDDCGLPYRVIVVDDGSTDGTADILTRYSERMPIIVRKHEVNQGLGRTMRDGLFAAAECARGRDIVVTMDADDTHTPGLVWRMVQLIREGHDVVIASRYQPGSRTMGVPLLRRFLSYAASWLFRCIFPIKNVRDFTCGFRAYRGEALQEAVERFGNEFVDQTGFQCMVDILLKMRRLNLIFGEVPFILRYDQKEGDSKMKVMRTITNTLRLMARRKLGG